MSEDIDVVLYATEKHKGQKRRGGEDYIEHPKRISKMLFDMGYKSHFSSIACLHDVLEDTDTTFEELVSLFGHKIANTVRILTHQKSESYEDYINRISMDTVATSIKICDIVDNLSDTPTEKQKIKYAKALITLYNDRYIAGLYEA